jgi:hypothetical protein
VRAGRGDAAGANYRFLWLRSTRTAPQTSARPPAAAEPSISGTATEPPNAYVAQHKRAKLVVTIFMSYLPRRALNTSAAPEINVNAPTAVEASISGTGLIPAKAEVATPKRSRLASTFFTQGPPSMNKHFHRHGRVAVE